MKRTCLSLLVFFLFSCIQVLKPKGHDDHYLDYSNHTRAIKYTEIDTEGLRKHLKSADTTLIVVFAYWCPYAHSFFNSSSYLNQNKRYHPIYISSNYETQATAKMIPQAMHDQLYVLSNSYYGSIENEKLRKFSSDLTQEEITGVPMHFLFFSDSLITSNYLHSEYYTNP